MSSSNARVAATASALDTALDLLGHGFWPIAIHSRGVKIGERITKGKEPIGEEWGLQRWDEKRLRAAFRKYPAAGVGICLGPGRGPGGSWLIDLECDGPRATQSLAMLLGEQIPPTLSWSSTRGWHYIFTADGKRLLELLFRAGGKEGTGIKVGAWHLEALPDLEIRVGGYKVDGSVKQVESVVPPTPGTDGKPRRWNRVKSVAELLEVAYAKLDGIAERIAITRAEKADQTAYQGGVSSNGNGTTAETRAIDYLAKLDPAIAGQGGHRITMRAACIPVRFGIDDPETVFRLLRDHYNDRCQPPWSESELRHKAEEACKTEKRRDLARGRGKTAAASPNGDGRRREIKVSDAIDDPHRLIQIFKGKRRGPNGSNMFIFYRGEYHRWRESAYHPIADYEMTAQLIETTKADFDRQNLLDIERWEDNGQMGKDGKPCPAPTVHKVTRRLMADVDMVLKASIGVDGDKEPPIWLIDNPPFPADGVLPARNALVHLPSFMEGKAKAIVAPTPEFFSTYALDYDFDPRAPVPEHFHAFLESIWPGDVEQKDALQEWFGYLLTPDTSQQKIAFLLGPPRSGRGTIARLIRALIGNQNVAGPTLSGLGDRFGLATMIGKPVAIIADAKLSGRADSGAIVERLLNISGEDVVDVNRKNKDQWIGKLPTRLMMLANELPRLPDQAGALASRFLMFRFRKSFLGKEDRELDARLRSELPGILLWAMEGRRRLLERGMFLQPGSGEADLEQIRDFNSPVGSWLRERANAGEGLRLRCELAFADWMAWCQLNNVVRPGNEATFGRNLRAVLPELDRARYRIGKDDGGGLGCEYIGLELKTTF